RDLMPGGCDLRRERRKPLDLLPDEEEGRGRVRARERLEHGRRSLRVRAVVEGDRDAIVVRQPELEAESARKGRDDGRRRGRRPGRRAEQPERELAAHYWTDASSASTTD